MPNKTRGLTEGKVSMNWMTIFFWIEIGIDVKHTNWNLHGKHEFELELIRKTGVRIGIDSKNTIWNWN
jgi:hypothetical protein